MTKQDWYGLTAQQKLNKVLELIEKEGHTASSLVDYFDIKTNRVITDFMNSRGYRKVDDKYIPKDSFDNIKNMNSTKKVIKKEQVNKVDELKTSTLAGIDEETIRNMLDLSNQHSKIKELLSWYDNIKDTRETKASSNHIEIIKADGKIKRTSIRINEVILSNFNELCKTKYSQYKQYDLLGVALQMFIDKYGKE